MLVIVVVVIVLFLRQLGDILIPPSKLCRNPAKILLVFPIGGFTVKGRRTYSQACGYLVDLLRRAGQGAALRDRAHPVDVRTLSGRRHGCADALGDDDDERRPYQDTDAEGGEEAQLGVGEGE